MFEIKRTEDDDGEFVRLVSFLINGVAQRHDADKLYLVHIKNWFDHKWLGFSGKYLGRASWRSKRKTNPPFNPNRVVAEKLLVRSETGDTYVNSAHRALHSWDPRPYNTWRPIPDDRTVYAWYSSQTERNDRGSLMVYVGQLAHWYASFVKKDNWRVHRFEGISRAEFDSYMKAGGAECDSATITDTHS